MENHLIIGLGGTGGRVLSAFRKIVHEKRNGDLRTEWLDYVYVDSSERDLKMEDPSLWTVMGQSIRLDESSLVRIPAANLSQYIENKSRYNYLSSWIGNASNWANIIRDAKIEEGAAGQKRRLGRLLFANGSPHFNETVGAKVAHLKENPDGQKINFHVVAGLAGGTGSGSIVDAIAQLRHNYSDTANYKIFLYLLLPENGQTHWATTPNYMPNGYAALTELNAMEMGEFCPWNVAEREYEVKRLQQKLPFYSAYLVTDENTQNVSFNVEKVVPASIAEFIFQKTLGIALNGEEKSVIGQTQDVSEFFDRAERGENPNYSEYDQKLSYNFMTYGIKRFAIPEVEIKEYFGYNFAAQALNQMLYNNLTKEKGYVSESKSFSDDDYSLVINKDNRAKWLITRPFLCLSQPILEDHKKEGWLPLNDEFSGTIKKITAKVMADEAIAHNDKMMAIHNLSKKYYDKDFRPIGEVGQNGVENFYNNKLKYGKQAIAEKIADNIGNNLFSAWMNGGYSLQHISELLGRLISSLKEEKDSLELAKSTANDNVQKATNEIKSLAQEWSGLSFISKLKIGNTANSIESNYCKSVTDKFAFMAWIKAYDFAQQLIDDIVVLLSVLKSNVDNLNSEFKMAVSDIEGEIENHCKVESEEDQSRKGMIIKYYDALKVHSMCESAIKQEESNKNRISGVRERLKERLASDKLNFKEASEKLRRGDIKQQIEQVVMQQATSFFANDNETRNIPQFEQMLNVNIVEKLRDEFSGNEEGLKDKLRRLVNHAAVMAKLNEGETHDGPQIRKSMFVIVPKYDKDQAFLDNLKKMIVGLAPSGSDYKVSEGGSTNEIIVMNLYANVTPRYLANVLKLREKYDTLMSSSSADVARFETHLEDYEKTLPKLYLLSDAEKKEDQKRQASDALPYLLLAKHIGIISQQEDQRTGIKKLTFIPEDEDGLPDVDNAILLGKNIEDSLDLIDTKVVDIIVPAVSAVLKKDYCHIEKQKLLMDSILEEVKTISSNNGATSELSKLFTVAYKAVKAIFEKMNE